MPGTGTPAFHNEEQMDQKKTNIPRNETSDGEQVLEGC
jgi:hypothetical protein